jgi:hypothetical protein
VPYTAKGLLRFRDLLARHTGGLLHGFAPEFQRRTARITGWPWLMAALSDRGWRTGTSPSAFLRAGQWYLDRWYALVPDHPRMFQDFARVANMLSGPAVLAHPRHLLRIMGPGPGSGPEIPD